MNNVNTENITGGGKTRTLVFQGIILGGIMAVVWLWGFTSQGMDFTHDGGASLSLVTTIAIWTHENLRGSLIPFVAVLLFFVVSVERLYSAALQDMSLESLAQSEHWVDLWTSLFFGIGVVWTAIGMRSALLAGLGNLDSSVAAEVGAFAILQRLVDGGILLALSTTIVGGIGGYMMRVYKGLRVGALLRKRYADYHRESESAVLDRLDRLEVHLAHLSSAVPSNTLDGRIAHNPSP